MTKGKTSGTRKAKTRSNKSGTRSKRSLEPVDNRGSGDGDHPKPQTRKSKSSSNRKTKSGTGGSTKGKRGPTKPTGKTRKPRKVKFDYQTYVKEALLEAGAEEKTTGFAINGWRVNINNRGVYWSNKLDDDFTLKFDLSGYEERSGKPFTPRADLTQQVADKFITVLKTTKTKRLISSESRKAQAEKRRDARRLPVRAWCKGCEWQTHKKKCDFMTGKHLEQYGVYTCTNKDWWEWNWCYNAERVVEDKKKLFIGHFKCKETGKRCPYNNESSIVPGEHLLGRNIGGEHFTTCDMYKGHRISPEEQRKLWDKAKEEAEANPKPLPKRRRRKKKAA
jgi:hypothetical protein